MSPEDGQVCMIGSMPPETTPDGSEEWIDDDTLRITFPARENMAPVIVKLCSGRTVVCEDTAGRNVLFSLASLHTEPDALRDFVRLHFNAYRAGRSQGVHDHATEVLHALRAAHVEDVERLESRVNEMAHDLADLKAARLLKPEAQDGENNGH